MPTIKEIREQFPQYADWSDSQLATALHRKFYADMPRAEFDAKIGFSAPRNQHFTFEEGQELMEREAQSGASGAAGAGMTGFIDGMPIIGPLMMGGAQRAAAGLSSLIDGEDYSTNLRQAQGVTNAAQEAHPYVTTGANVAGAVAGTIPMVMAAPTAFGAGAGGMAGRSMLAGLTGSILGGADAAIRSGGDLEAAKVGAGFGGAMGLAGPTVGKLVGAGARGLADFVRNSRVAKMAGTTPKALGALDEVLSADGLDAAAVRQRLSDLGPHGMMADLGPGAQAKAAGLAAMPGRAQSIVRDAVETRAAGANARLAQVIDETLGPNVIPSQLDDAIRQGQQSLSPAYGEVFRTPRRYDFTPITDDLDRSITTLRGDAQRRLQQVRQMMNVHNTQQVSADPRVAFQTRQAIDGMLTTEADPKVISALSEARQMLDDALTRAVPDLKAVDARYAELARQRDALTRGQQVLDSGRTAPRPSELAREVQEGALPQGMQVGPSAVPLRLSQGARAEVDRILGNNANDIARLNALIKSEGDWNRSRLATLFGQDKADRLFRALENELAFARTRNAVVGNSETARRQQSIAALGGSDGPDLVRQSYAAGGLPALPRAAGVKLADKILNSILKGRQETANASLADLITANRSNVVDALAARQGAQYDPAMVEQLTRAILLGSGVAGSR